MEPLPPPVPLRIHSSHSRIPRGVSPEPTGSVNVAPNCAKAAPEVSHGSRLEHVRSTPVLSMAPRSFSIVVLGVSPLLWNCRMPRARARGPRLPDLGRSREATRRRPRRLPKRERRARPKVLRRPRAKLAPRRPPRRPKVLLRPRSYRRGPEEGIWPSVSCWWALPSVPTTTRSTR